MVFDGVEPDPLVIAAYRGYGTSDRLYLRGRVLEDEGATPSRAEDGVWQNLRNTLRRFESDEVPGARVLARFQGVEQEVVSDREGYFELELRPTTPLPSAAWHTVELELLEPHTPGTPPVRATGQVLVPPAAARFGVISDIDDTVVQTGATSLREIVRSVLLSNARTRLPFAGVAAFYRALSRGVGGEENPQFFVSSSPWNLYEPLSEFFALNGISDAPVLFLRDWGIRRATLPFGHRDHKLGIIRRMLDAFPALPFILIGDSGQQDPEIYHEVVRDYPGRILAVYIRNVSREPERLAAINRLAEEVVAAGSALVLSDDTLAAARHAAEHGWIAADALDAIAAEKRADKPVDTTQPTVTIDGAEAAPPAAAEVGDTVEQTLDTGPGDEPPPTVVVEGDKPKGNT